MTNLRRRQHIVIVFIVCIAWGCLLASCRDAPPPVTERSEFTDLRVFKKAFTTRQNNLQVTQQGEIIRILSDDRTGSKHQRCIVKLSSGQTLLIAHNIDLAPRVPHLKTGEQLTFHGEYEWNEKGGVIHWTHHDPDGKHKDGWLKYQGKIYQ